MYLRDKNIGLIDSDLKSGLDLSELVNCECLFASHNMIRDLFGISNIGTGLGLKELNLSFNQIADITYSYLDRILIT